MFHTYITSSCGNKVDIDRASFLMNQKLYKQVLNELYFPAKEAVYINWPEVGRMDWDCAMRDTMRLMPRQCWNRYCELHYEKYDEPFMPDIKSDWDN